MAKRVQFRGSPIFPPEPTGPASGPLFPAGSPSNSTPVKYRQSTNGKLANSTFAQHNVGQMLTPRNPNQQYVLMSDGTVVPLSSLSQQQQAQLGGSNNGDYWDRAYAAYRSGGELQGTYNAYGQPVGTRAPSQVRGPRRMNAGPGGVVTLTPEQIQEQYNQTQTMLEAEKERLNNWYNREKAGGRGRGRWDPLAYRYKRLQNRLGILEAKGATSTPGVGIASGLTGELVKWNP